MGKTRNLPYRFPSFH